MMSFVRSLKQSLGWGRASASEELGSLRQRGFLLERSEGTSWALYLMDSKDDLGQFPLSL